MAQKLSYAKDFVKSNPIVSIGGTALILFVGYRLIRKYINKPIIPIVPPIPPVPGEPIEPSQKKYTYLAQQYADFADNIADACSGPGTDENMIKNIMEKMVTKADVLALIDAYGRRAISTPYGWDTDAMTLSQTLKYELSADDINVYVNQPLKRTGYKF